jgi:CheY-like chemotaxis protein
MYNPQQTHNDLPPIKRILIVEDDSTMGNILLEVLRDETPYQVLLVPSAEMALSMLQMVEPDLFLLDYHLPRMNGLELIDQLRNRTEYKQRPILLMSAYFPPGKIAGDHIRTLQKPFDLETLLQLIVKLLTPY